MLVSKNILGLSLAQHYKDHLRYPYCIIYLQNFIHIRFTLHKPDFPKLLIFVIRLTVCEILVSYINITNKF